MKNDNIQPIEGDSKPTSSKSTLNSHIDKFNKAKNILKKYNQEHLLCLFDELSESEKEKLLNQILTINFEEILQNRLNSQEENKMLEFVKDGEIYQVLDVEKLFQDERLTIC